jgi:hypothetical protein
LDFAVDVGVYDAFGAVEGSDDDEGFACLFLGKGVNEAELDGLLTGATEIGAGADEGEEEDSDCSDGAKNEAGPEDEGAAFEALPAGWGVGWWGWGAGLEPGFEVGGGMRQRPRCL